MKNESVKESLEKSKNVPEEKRKNGLAKNLRKKKTNTFSIIDMNFVQEQLIMSIKGKRHQHVEKCA